MIAIIECPLCGSENFVPFLTCMDHSVSHETFELKRCGKCDFVVTTPRPDHTELAKYYLSPAYISHVSKAQSWMDRLYLLARNFTLKWKLSLIEKQTLSSAKSKTLLDYGCGTGEFLRAAKGKGWDTRGIEPSPTARIHASAQIKGDIAPSLEDLVNNNHFDVITLWHVLEHVSDLDKTILKLKSLLSDSGTLFIAVPNHLSWDGKKYGAQWAGYDVPRHLWHFSKENIKMLLEKNQMRLVKIIPMRLDAIYICLLSEKYKAGGVLTISGAFKALLKGIRSNLAATRYGAHSSMIFIATK